MNETLRDQGIEVSGSGQKKVKCPKCQMDRKPQHKHNKPLSVNTEKGVWKCWNCGWEGGLMNNPLSFIPRKSSPKVFKPCPYTPQELAEERLKKGMADWFAKRGIPADLVVKRGITVRKTYLAETARDEWVFSFPFYKDGKVVNVKNRGVKDKVFSSEKGCEPVFYGLDTIPENSHTLVLCEGELDQLSLQLASYAALSVPNGANSPLDECLQSAESVFMSASKVVLAGDQDSPGRDLMRKLSQRIGQEKCYRAAWPEDCKDANEVLVKHGIEALKQCIDSAAPLPITGTISMADVRDHIWDAYEEGFPKGVHPGWDVLDEYYHPRLGETTYVTGIPGAGKSCFVSALAVNLAEHEDWKFTVFSPEQFPPWGYYSQLLELYTGKSISHGALTRMETQEVEEAMNWVEQRFWLIDLQECHSLEDILEVARRHVYRYGIKGLILDPWNEIEHVMKDHITEHNYIAYALRLIRRFAQQHQVHVWVIAHPTKPVRSTGNSDDQVPSLYDIAGSSNFYNKCDNGLILHRDKKAQDGKVTVFISKIRFKYSGKLGKVDLFHQRATGRYVEIPTVIVGGEEAPF